MTEQEIKYELNQMSNEEINSWMIRYCGETIQSLYGNLSRRELISEIASDFAQ